MGQSITALDVSDDDDLGFNMDGSGDISVIHFGNAIQVWAFAQDREVKIAEAALAFNVRPELICQAIENHAWMSANAAGEIEHEGE